MNDKTNQLIEQLAQTLGTTTKYLWSVLLKEAPIDATISLLLFVAVIIFGLVLWKIHKKLMKKDINDITLYEEYDLSATVPMGFALFILTALVFACFFNVGDIVNGYFNPEYWALHTLLRYSQHL